MANRIRDVQVVNHRLDPHEAELRVIVELAEMSGETQIKGRLMGPRSVYSSTVEIAYSLKEIERTNPIVLSAVIPEPCWWEPKTPFLYQGPLEVWQDGVLCDRRELSHGIRNLQWTPKGLRLNGRPFVLRGKAVESPFDEGRVRQWHDDGINVLLPTSNEALPDTGLSALADRFGFFVIDAGGFTSFGGNIGNT